MTDFLFWIKSICNNDCTYFYNLLTSYHTQHKEYVAVANICKQ